MLVDKSPVDSRSGERLRSAGRHRCVAREGLEKQRRHGLAADRGASTRYCSRLQPTPVIELNHAGSRLSMVDGAAAPRARLGRFPRRRAAGSRNIICCHARPAAVFCSNSAALGEAREAYNTALRNRHAGGREEALSGRTNRRAFNGGVCHAARVGGEPLGGTAEPRTSVSARPSSAGRRNVLRKRRKWC